MTDVTRKLTTVFVISMFGVLAFASGAAAQGRFDFGFHFGPWSINLLKPAIEKFAQDFGDQITQKELDKLRKDYPGIDFTVLTTRTQIDFDSSGSNYGFEARWYPQGEGGSFSIGLAAEKSSFKVGLPSVSSAVALTDPITHLPWSLTARANGAVEAKPLAVMLSFRWDIIPSAWLHPYLTVGLGAAGVGAWEQTTLQYSFNGQVISPIGPLATISESSSKTLLQLKKEYDQKIANGDRNPGSKPFEYPSIFPMVQVNVGLKAKVAPMVYVLVDGGVLDGFALRIGLSVRP